MHSFRFYLLLGSLFVYFNTSHSKAKITVGLLAPFTGSWDRAPRFASAVAIAVDYINKNTTLLQSHDLDYFVHDTACSESGGVAAAVNLMQRNVSVFIGPACSKSCQNAGFVAAAYNIPMVSYGCSTTTLSNTKLYPNLFRTKPFARGSKRSTSLAIASIMDDFNWKYCCFAEDIDSVFTPLAEEIASVFTKRSIKIGRIERFYQENYDAMDVMRKLRPFCRGRFFDIYYFYLTCQPSADFKHLELWLPSSVFGTPICLIQPRYSYAWNHRRLNHLPSRG